MANYDMQRIKLNGSRRRGGLLIAEENASQEVVGADGAQRN